jgi:hypothetical protein
MGIATAQWLDGAAGIRLVVARLRNLPDAVHVSGLLGMEQRTLFRLLVFVAANALVNAYAKDLF